MTATGPTRKKKVLLVDDDADFVEMNKVVLEKAGFEVLTAFNGRECLTKATAESPDIIILDVMMATPTDGFHVSYNLRETEKTKKIPILMLTSINQIAPHRFEPDEDWLPVNSFLEKPVLPERLLAEINKRLTV